MRRLLLPGLLVVPLLIALAPLAGVLWAGDSDAGGEVVISLGGLEALNADDANVRAGDDPASAAEDAQSDTMASVAPERDCMFSSDSSIEG